MHGVLLTTPSRFLHWLANSVTHVFIAGLIDRLASFVGFVTEMSFAYIARALNRHLFADRIIGRAVFGDRAFVVDDVLHHFVLGGAARSGRAKISTG